MVIREYGNPTGQVIVLIHPIFGDNRSMQYLADQIGGEYRYILPDLSGHGEDQSDFVSTKEESRMLVNYLISNGINDVALMVGFCYGAVVALQSFIDARIKFHKILMEGAPLYDDGFLRQMKVQSEYSGMQKKVMTQPDSANKTYTEQYGPVYGPLITQNLMKISKNSLKNLVQAIAKCEFPAISEKQQRRMVFSYGKKEENCKNGLKQIEKHYPYGRVMVKEELDHLECVFRHTDDYMAEIRQLLPS